MKKVISIVLSLLLLCSVLIPVSAVEVPVITQQPQSITYKEFAVATYSVTVKGEYLKCKWYLHFNGYDYDISKVDEYVDPWEHYAGSSYGSYSSTKDGHTTFTYYFEGIGSELDGCYIYADIEDGHFALTSQKAYIRVTPYEESEITIHVPAYIEAYQGDIVDLYCSAISSDGSALDYLWYGCSTGNIENIIAVNRGSEDSDTLRVDTSYPGTYYYTCYVSTDSNGAYSDMVRVTVLEKNVEMDPPEITTKYLPDGTVGENYYTKLNCTNPDASFGIYYNPGKLNEFEKTGLILTQHGEIEGVPAKAGTFGFTVTVVDEYGQQGYQVYTLNILEPAEATEPEQTEDVTEDTLLPTEDIADPTAGSNIPTDDAGDTEDPVPAVTPSKDNKFNLAAGGILLLVLIIGLCLLIPIILVVVVIIIIVKKKKAKKTQGE